MASIFSHPSKIIYRSQFGPVDHLYSVRIIYCSGLLLFFPTLEKKLSREPQSSIHHWGKSLKNEWTGPNLVWRETLAKKNWSFKKNESIQPRLQRKRFPPLWEKQLLRILMIVPWWEASPLVLGPTAKLLLRGWKESQSSKQNQQEHQHSNSAILPSLAIVCAIEST